MYAKFQRCFSVPDNTYQDNPREANIHSLSYVIAHSWHIVNWNLPNYVYRVTYLFKMSLFAEKSFAGKLHLLTEKEGTAGEHLLSVEWVSEEKQGTILDIRCVTFWPLLYFSLPTQLRPYPKWYVAFSLQRGLRVSLWHKLSFPALAPEVFH